MDNMIDQQIANIATTNNTIDPTDNKSC